MTEIILIRHGETAWNRERRMQGQIDTPLSDTGRTQAEALGQRMAKHPKPFSAIYSSDLSRAYDTAAAIAKHSGHEIRRDPALRERAFGIFEGLTYAEMSQRYPEEHTRFSQRDPDYAVPGGESPRAFYERGLACVNGIADAHPDERVVVVTHGMVLDTLYRAAYNLPLPEKREAPLFNASLNTFRREGGQWIGVTWGDITHLTEAGITVFDWRTSA
jgi:probable phosphoglycerate mutase